MGGGTIRTAAKVASFGAYRSPIIDETARRASRVKVSTWSSAVPALESGQSAPFLSSDKEQAEANPTPRQVFGPAPTLEEAKEATSDLKEALEKMCFQPNLSLNSHEGCQNSVSCESSTVSSIPKHVAQMFSLLQRGTEAQVVVASLASDKCVWDAVMNNEKVVEFCQKTSCITESTNVAESVATNEFPIEFSPSLESKETSEGSMLFNIVNGFKVKVLEMLSNLSDFLQDFFGVLPANSNSTRAKTTASTAEAYSEMALGASFVALAIATIMVVLLKRG